MENVSVKEWISNVIKPEQVEKYLNNGQDFINEGFIMKTMMKNKQADKQSIREIIAKSKELIRLNPDEPLHFKLPGWRIMAGNVYSRPGNQTKVYGRHCTFAPLYIRTIG